MLNNCYKQETPMTLFIASSYKTFKPFVQMTNLSKVGEGHSQTFGNPYKSIILKDNTVPMVTPKGEKWNMPLTLQRLIDHISGATWFDITKFALKIKSSIFVLVNWKKKKNLILFDLSWGAVKEKQIFFELDNPLLSLLQTPEQPQLCSNSRALNGPWQIYSLATDPQRREDWGTLFYFETRKGKLFKED